MILLWIFTTIIGLVVFLKLVRIIAVVVVVAMSAAAAFLITAVTAVALGLEASRDIGAVVGLFVFSLLAILTVCRALTHQRGALASGKTGRFLRRSRQKRPIDIDGVSLGTLSENAISGVDVRSKTDDLDDLRRLRKAGRGTFSLRRSKSVALEGAGRLQVSWNIIEARSDGCSARIAVAKQSCTRLLTLEAYGPFAGSALDAVTNIRKGVPELVETWLKHAATAGTAERRRGFVEMVASIERVAARAERETETLMRSNAEAFAFQRDHLNRRSGEDWLVD